MKISLRCRTVDRHFLFSISIGQESFPPFVYILLLFFNARRKIHDLSQEKPHACKIHLSRRNLLCPRGNPLQHRKPLLGPVETYPPMILMPHTPSLSNMKHLLQFSSAQLPTLYWREQGQRSEQVLETGSEVRIAFSPTRACIGYKSDTDWHACLNRSVHVKQCPTCQFKDVARCYTVGDFSLYPHLHEQLSTEKYVLYLAQFGTDLTKLGLTRRSRLAERWKEQGADFAAALLEFDGPDEAYGAEHLLQERYGLLNAVRTKQKFDRLHFDRAKAKARLDGLLARIHADPSLSSYLVDEPAVDLSSHYPTLHDPESVDFIGGTILGSKGAWLFFSGPSGQHYGVNLSEKIGRFMSEEATDGTLAAGLEWKE